MDYWKHATAFLNANHIDNSPPANWSILMCSNLHNSSNNNDGGALTWSWFWVAYSNLTTSPLKKFLVLIEELQRYYISFTSIIFKKTKISLFERFIKYQKLGEWNTIIDFDFFSTGTKSSISFDIGTKFFLRISNVLHYIEALIRYTHFWLLNFGG